MILTQRELAGLESGVITCAFRRWKRPSVKGGGTLLTAAGAVADPRRARRHSRRDHRSPTPAAPAIASAAALAEVLARWPEGTLYRIDFGALTADPRVALRARATLTDEERASLLTRLDRLDAAAAGGPWTRQTLAAIREHEGLRAADLGRLVGQDRLPFKVNVRKLKAMGLTESLEVGYRLSPRGRALLEG